MVSGDYRRALAERVRFELTVPVKVQRFSRPSRSTTPAPLRGTRGYSIQTAKRKQHSPDPLGAAKRAPKTDLFPRTGRANTDRRGPRPADMFRRTAKRTGGCPALSLNG